MKPIINVKIVLVETSHPGNIGAVARAMKNMCLSQLVLVNPQEFPSPVATARATGATDVLNNAVVCRHLSEAVADCQKVIGASARLRSVAWPQLTPREFGENITGQWSGQNVAVVFGREDSGLSNEELDICQFLLHIPTNPEFSSLNIAAAVQVVCYEIFQNVQGDQPVPLADDLASNDDMHGLFNHMESALTEIGFLKPPSCNKLLRRLRRLFNRAQLDKTDVNILRGILSAAEGRKYEWQKRKIK